MKTRLDFVSNSSSSSYIIAIEDNPHMMVLNDPMVLTLKELVHRFGERLFIPYCLFMQDHVRICEVSDSKFIKAFLSGTNKIVQFVETSNAVYEHIFTMPKSAANALKLYLTMYFASSSKQYAELNDIIFKQKSRTELTELDRTLAAFMQYAKDTVVDACYKVLKTKLSKMLFCYQEIEDNYRGTEVLEDPFKLSVDPDHMRHSYDVEDVMRSRVNKTFYEDCSMVQANDECLVDARIAFLEKLRGPFKFKRVFSNH